MDTAEPCDPGFFCESNVLEQTVCADGYYQPNPQQSECLECPAGFYCPDQDAFDDSAVLISNEAKISAIPCEAGHYCPKKSHAMTECGTGNWMPFLGAQSAGDCIPCLTGYTCGGSTTITDVSEMTDCTAGFYCPAGGIEIICPRGSYCPLNSETHIKCDVGYTRNDQQGIASTDCSGCEEHYFCGERGMTQSEAGLCGNGFLCLGPLDGIATNVGTMSAEPT